MDRLVGYTLSPLLSKKVRRGLSAGRVQSVAVRIVVEREREIRAFEAREYWTLEALLAAPDGTEFTADVVAHRRQGAGHRRRRHGEPPRGRPARPPAGRGLGRDPCLEAQPGAAVHDQHPPAGGEPQAGLQPQAHDVGRAAAVRGRGHARRARRPDHLHAHGLDGDRGRGDGRGPGGDQGALRRDRTGRGKGRVYKTKAKGAQEAHESVRPTAFHRDPDSMRSHLKADELKLYRLIWQRALASQMAPKELETTTIELTDGDYRLRASATRTLFDGFARVYTEGQDDTAEEADRTLPALREGDATRVLDVTPSQHFTEPPPRFTEATLIKALEEHGIGRPSTYAATISTILDRGYVRVEARRLHPEEIGEIVTDYLVAYFGDYVDLTFTARMEGDLDEVARGERAWVPLLRAFFDPLKTLVDTEGDRPKPPGEPTDEVCSLGHPMVIRLGRNGKFLACSTYPDHKETRPLPGEETPQHGGRRRDVPPVRRGDARDEARTVRRLRRLLALSGVQLHQEGRPAAAGSAAVRGGLPQARGRNAGGASRAADRKRLLGVLPLPQVRLHHERRADGRRPRRHPTPPMRTVVGPWRARARPASA